MNYLTRTKNITTRILAKISFILASLVIECTSDETSIKSFLVTQNDFKSFKKQIVHFEHFFNMFCKGYVVQSVILIWAIKFVEITTNFQRHKFAQFSFCSVCDGIICWLCYCICITLEMPILYLSKI